MPRCLVCLAVLSVAVAAARAAPLPKDPALDRPVTAEADGGAAQVLAVLSKAGGVKLAADEHVADWRIALCVRDVPLRHVMSAIVANPGPEWKREGDGAYRLTSPTIEPEPMPNARLVEKLLACCPSDVRPPLGMPRPQAVRALPAADRIYTMLPPALRNAIEEGEEIPFARLPSEIRRLIEEYRRETARQTLWSILSPRWMVPPEDLALRLQGFGPGTSANWDLRYRVPPPAEGASGRPALEWGYPDAYVPYQPLQPADPTDPKRSVPALAMQVARKTGTSVVLSPFDWGWTASGEPQGDSPEAMLRSLVKESEGTEWPVVWELRDGIFQLPQQQPAPGAGAAEAAAPAPLSARARRNLKSLLPPVYRPLLAMDTSQRYWATRGPWIRLWESLTEEQRKRGALVLVSDLSPEQQGLLCAGLQSQMVSRFVEACDGLGDLSAAVMSLDFRLHRSAYGQRYGYPRSLKVPYAGGRLESQPYLLRLLPSTSLPAFRMADLELKDAPLSEVAERLSEALDAPVIIEEPEREVKLAAKLKKKPLCLLLHWVERRTGLQWRKRGDVFVLAPPFPLADVLKDHERVLALLRRGIPPNARPYETHNLSEEDRGALASGRATVSELSPELQEAIRSEIGGIAQSYTWGSPRDSLGLLNRLSEARIRLQDGENGKIVCVGAPGASMSWAMPKQGGQK